MSKGLEGSGNGGAKAATDLLATCDWPDLLIKASQYDDMRIDHKLRVLLLFVI